MVYIVKFNQILNGVYILVEVSIYISRTCRVLFRHFLDITFQRFYMWLILAKYHWRGFSTRNAPMVHIVN